MGNIFNGQLEKFEALPTLRRRRYSYHRLGINRLNRIRHDSYRNNELHHQFQTGLSLVMNLIGKRG